MTKEREHIIILLDVLGFKNLFEKIGLDEIESKYRELIKVAEEHNFEGAFTIGPGGHPMYGNPGIKSAYFSDTIIFWCPYDPFRMEIIFDSMREVLCRSIEIGLPLRGSISIGDVRIDKEKGVFLGKPIIEAALGETAQKWIGITLSKKFDFEPYNGGFKADMILEYSNHIKNDFKDFLIPLAIDFPRHWRLKRKTSLIEAIKKLDTDERFTEYYKNTIEFVEYSEENHDWWKKHPEFIKEIERRKKEAEKKESS